MAWICVGTVIANEEVFQEERIDEMGQLHDMEDCLFKRWMKALGEKSVESVNFVADGVVNEDDATCGFDSSHPRLIFVLKEPNGGYSYDMRDLIRKGNHSGERGTWWPIANMLADPSVDGVRSELENTPECKAKYFQRIGIMNLKKKPGGGKTNPVELRRFVKENANYLYEQISLYTKKPTIFACGGTFDLFKKILRQNKTCFNETRGMICLGDGCVAFGMWHPAYFGKSLDCRVKSFAKKYNEAVKLMSDS